jgi:hypothetical protein
MSVLKIEIFADGRFSSAAFNPDSALEVTQRSRGKPSGAKTMGQRLVAACHLQWLQ